MEQQCKMCQKTENLIVETNSNTTLCGECYSKFNQKLKDAVTYQMQTAIKVELNRIKIILDQIQDNFITTEQGYMEIFHLDPAKVTAEMHNLQHLCIETVLDDMDYKQNILPKQKICFKTIPLEIFVSVMNKVNYGFSDCAIETIYNHYKETLEGLDENLLSAVTVKRIREVWNEYQNIDDYKKENETECETFNELLEEISDYAIAYLLENGNLLVLSL